MPDLNSVPPSPHSLAVSRRRSSHNTMPPPPVPQSPSLHVLPSNQGVVGHAQSHSRSQSQSHGHGYGHGHGPSSSSTSSFAPPNQSSGSQPAFSPALDSGVGPGPGPLRHPRPLTATELHMQLEKEQEAVVRCQDSPRQHCQADIRLGEPLDARTLLAPRGPERLCRFQRILHLGHRVDTRAPDRLVLAPRAQLRHPHCPSPSS